MSGASCASRQQAWPANRRVAGASPAPSPPGPVRRPCTRWATSTGRSPTRPLHCWPAHGRWACACAGSASTLALGRPIPTPLGRPSHSRARWDAGACASAEHSRAEGFLPAVAHRSVPCNQVMPAPQVGLADEQLHGMAPAACLGGGQLRSGLLTRPPLCTPSLPCAQHPPSQLPLRGAPAAQVFDQAIALGFSMSVLDLGGGYPGGQWDAAGAFNLAPVAAAINRGLAKQFPTSCGVTVIAEPGRWGLFVLGAAYSPGVMHWPARQHRCLDQAGHPARRLTRPACAGSSPRRLEPWPAPSTACARVLPPAPRCSGCLPALSSWLVPWLPSLLPG